MANWVVDASAVLALLSSEPGADAVRAALPTSLLSSVNASEVVAKLVARGAPPDIAMEIVTLLPCEIASVDGELGLRAGALYAVTSQRGLSLGDRICLALAQQEGLPALTADRSWAELAIGIEVSLTR